MSCTSWIFVHKHLSDAPDGNGSIIERKVLWREDDADLGIALCSYFDLPNGGYQYASHNYLCEYLDDLIEKSPGESEGDLRKSLTDLRQIVGASSEDDDYFVSVDW